MAAPKLSEEIKKQALEAYEATGHDKAKAARLLGWAENTYRSRYEAAIRDKSVAHLDPYIPEGQKLRGVSTLYNGAGEVAMQWVKTKEDLDRTLEIIRQAAEAFKDEMPRALPVPFAAPFNSDLLSVYVLTDYHIGQFSWAAEAGEKWNTELSVKFLVDWFATAINSAPPSEVGVLCQLGDFLHYDGLEAVTPTSRHNLDADARYGQIVAAAIIALRCIIEMMLKKHKRVHIIMAEGNHDMASSVWLRTLFKFKYENEPRVTVDDTAVPYYAVEWGKTSIFFHHGHKKKMTEVSKVFAALYREMFGRTEYSFAHMGHYHHIASKEDGMMIVEQHPTMAVKDAYAARGGYLSNRGASVITYSKKHGEVSRLTVRPEMVAEENDKNN